ncbi:MAG: nitrogen fixation protein NifZ [Magnetospirillum sp. WYHS-4]
MPREPDVDIFSDPVFDFGQKVRSRKNVKNDGTFAGAEIGEVLVRKGEEGYVRDIGTFLQQFHVYAVEFIGTGRIVGMRAAELESLEGKP